MMHAMTRTATLLALATAGVLVFQTTAITGGQSAAGRPAPSRPAGSRPAVGRPAANPPAATDALATTAEGLATQLRAVNTSLKTMLDGGQLPSMPKAAMRAKTVALALGSTGTGLDASLRTRLDARVRRVVIEAWTLEAASDAADLAQVTHAQGRLSQAVEALLALPRSAAAPRPRTGPVTYGGTVVQVLQTHCTPCHLKGGVAPVPLLTYADAARAASAIRAQVTAEAMPPRYADPTGPAVTGPQGLTAEELDALITWASQATPEAGPPVTADAPAESAWPLGSPSYIMTVPARPPAAAGARQAPIRVDTGLTEDLWLRAIDVWSADPSRVRAATVRIEDGPVVSAWLPGEAPVAAPGGTAFLLPAGRALLVDLTDGASRSTAAVRLGLYTSAAIPAEGRLTTLPVTDALTLAAPVRVLAVRADAAEPVATTSLIATLPSGVVVPLLTLRGATPGWNRRYWLATPVDLPAGTSVAVQVSGENPAVELLVTAR